jgi:hypothetical protein
MKRIIPLFAAALFGVGVGWYFGYTRPTAKNYRELLSQYQYVRDNFHMTDADMAEAGPKIPQYFEDMKRQDETAAMVALGAFSTLEHGNVEGAKARLLRAVGGYYRVYHGKVRDTNFIATIERAARKYPAVAAEISTNNPTQ